MPFGPHERAVFEEQSTPLYEEIVSAGGISTGDARIAEHGELHEAFRMLVDVGLVTRGDDGAHWRATQTPELMQSIKNQLSGGNVNTCSLKLSVERDLYKSLYEQLLNKLTA